MTTILMKSVSTFHNDNKTKKLRISSELLPIPYCGGGPIRHISACILP